eukprot:942650_1
MASFDSTAIPAYPSDMAQPKVVLLWSSLSTNSRQAGAQKKIHDLLVHKKIRFELLDGSQEDNKDHRNQFFDLSKLRGKYPQIFIVQNNYQKIDFIGMDDDIQEIIDVEQFDTLFANTFKYGAPRKADHVAPRQNRGGGQGGGQGQQQQVFDPNQYNKPMPQQPQPNQYNPQQNQYNNQNQYNQKPLPNKRLPSKPLPQKALPQKPPPNNNQFGGYQPPVQNQYGAAAAPPQQQQYQPQQQQYQPPPQQQQQQQQQQTYGMWFMDCVYRIDCCAAFGDSVVSFFMKYNEPSRRRVEVKNEMIEMIQSRVNSVKRKEQQNQNWMVFVFGSESWNIRSIYSDIDIGIQLPFRSKREEKRMFLKQLMCAISKEEVKALQCVSLIHAQYPIIRIRSADKMQFDVSIADEYCIQNKKIINELFDEFERIHVPVRPLVVFVKYWAKQRGILNAFGRYLNSFGYTILTLNYLQFVINNGLLQQGQSYRDYLCYLIYGLFFFYSKCFDVTKHSIQIMRNVCGYQDYVFYDKMNTDSLLQIIDPANGRNNIARKVGYVEYRRIHEEFCRSYQLCNAFSRDHVLKSSLFEQLTQFFK